jgi:hypothetical protein
VTIIDASATPQNDAPIPTAAIEGPPWLCPECDNGREFATRAALAGHRKTHGVTLEAKPAKPGLRERVWGRRDANGHAPKEEKPARPRVRRQDASDFLERVWAALGRQIERRDLPVGRCVQLEASIAGVVLEESIKGTWADRPIQWLARKETDATRLGAIFAAPLIVGMMERNAPAAEALVPYLEDAFVALGPSLAKAIVKAEKRRADFEEAMSGLGPALGKPDGEPVTMNDILGWLFPPVEAPAP